jgi:hypothetical protein
MDVRTRTVAALVNVCVLIIICWILWSKESRQSEVCHFDQVVVANKNVGSPEIAVYELLLFEISHAFGNLEIQCKIINGCRIA